jgi:hypothetical protein
MPMSEPAPETVPETKPVIKPPPKECTPRRRKLCGKPECVTCTSRSIFPVLASHNGFVWSEKNTESPYVVNKNSLQSYYFDCTTCGHSTHYRPTRMAKYWPRSCQYCVYGILCGDNGCTTCTEKSFEHLLSGIPELTCSSPFLRHVHRDSTREFLMRCTICGNLFPLTPSDILRGVRCECTNIL